jgi:hypothetical protein
MSRCKGCKNLIEIKLNLVESNSRKPGDEEKKLMSSSFGLLQTEQQRKSPKFSKVQAVQAHWGRIIDDMFFRKYVKISLASF